MMSVRRILSCLALAAAVLFPGVCPADGAIRWGVADNPPYHILRGPDANTGYSDVVRLFFASRMPEFKHQKVEMTLARLMESARLGEEFCYCNLRKTPEREALFYYSDATSLTPGPRIYVRPDSPALALAENGVVSLKRLLADGFNCVAESGRSFGVASSRLLAGHAESVQRQLQPDMERKYALVRSRRVDFFMEYPFVVQRYIRTARLEQELIPLIIAEEDAYVRSYVVATKTPFGKRVIDRMNEVLRAAKGTPEHRKVFMTMVAGLGPRFQAECEELYRKFLVLD